MRVKEVISRTVGRRRIIDAYEAEGLLLALERDAEIDLGSNPYHAPAATHWVETIQGITFVSVSGPGKYLRRDGMIRYDQPGSMAPMQHMDLSLVPAGMEGINYIREHADRTIQVRPAPRLEPEPEQPAVAATEKMSASVCENYHRWTFPISASEKIQNVCPACGEYAV